MNLPQKEHLLIHTESLRDDLSTLQGACIQIGYKLSKLEDEINRLEAEGILET